MSENKVSSEVFKSCVDKHCEPIKPVKVKWHDIEILIKPMLSFVEMLGFVEKVADACFANDTNEYVPAMKDFAINCGLISVYTNIELPDDIEEKYSYVMRSDIYGVLFDTIDGIQFEQMISAIDKKINILANTNVNALQKEVSELYSLLNELQLQANELLGNISSDDIENMLSFISSGSLNEEKIVDAYLKGKGNERSK